MTTIKLDIDAAFMHRMHENAIDLTELHLHELHTWVSKAS